MIRGRHKILALATLGGECALLSDFQLIYNIFKIVTILWVNRNTYTACSDNASIYIYIYLKSGLRNYLSSPSIDHVLHNREGLSIGRQSITLILAVK